MPFASLGLPDVKIFEVNAMAAEPGRVTDEPDREPNYLIGGFVDRHVCMDQRRLGEKGRLEIGGGGQYFIDRSFISGQLDDLVMNRGHISR